MAGCSGDKATPSFDRIELFSGSGAGAGETVILLNDGAGQYVSKSLDDPSSQPVRFVVKPERFTAMVAELEPMRRDAKPVSEGSDGGQVCRSEDYAPDAGSFSIRWTGSGHDELVTYDLGCDAKLHAARNIKLRALMRDLPIPRGTD